jgi:N-acetylmuramic acid 6-phosphate etherase
MFNNPAELLCDRLERSRAVIRNPEVCVLDLSCGPMALAGSTRMQATTSEQLVAGAALENILRNLAGIEHPDTVSEFGKLLDSLERPQIVKMIAGSLDFEAQTYRHAGKITCFADAFLLDIFTDTTERSPTFMLPPFRRRDDHDAPEPWAFVKNPLYDTRNTWLHAMHRPLRCIEWTPEDYRAMGAPENIVRRPPAIRADDLLAIPVGNEDTPDRYLSGHDAAVLLSFGRDEKTERVFDARFAPKFRTIKRLDLDVLLPFAQKNPVLELMRHMAIKLFLNTVSTGCMTLLGRVTGNWMSWVNVSNKKLLDRGIRLVAEIGGTDYRTACIALFDTIETLKKHPADTRSPVQFALDALRARTTK